VRYLLASSGSKVLFFYLSLGSINLNYLSIKLLSVATN